MTTVPAEWMQRVPMKRIICHWSVGNHKASEVDKEHYHILIEGDGNLVKGDHDIADNVNTADDDYAAHTLHCNQGSIGVGLACMIGAVENPFNAGPQPMTKTQFDKLAFVIADLCNFYGIPITPKTVLSHAEVQGTLGIRQRGKWDYTHLPFDPSFPVGAKPCGDRLRKEAQAALAALQASKDAGP